MTQQEQHEFRESLAEALSWMQAVQERLKQNDNTQGPRSALEVRLQETEVRPFLTFDLLRAWSDWNRAISVSHFNFSKAFETVSQEIYRLINLKFPFVVKKIHSSEPEGHVKMDRVLVASEALLRNGDEEMKNQTLSKLKDIKALWEETSTYIIHCHRYRLCP